MNRADLEAAIQQAGVYPAQEIPRPYWTVNGGYGICQFPVQFAPYLLKVRELGIRRYAEIGTWVGGTFRFTVEYLRGYGLEAALAVDIDVKPGVREFADESPDVSWIESDSRDPKAAKALRKFKPDLILVDGDHTEEGARADCKLAMSIAPYVAVHDIVGDGFPGVRKVWGELVGKKRWEFIDQHPDHPTPQNGMGLLKV